MTDMFAPLQTVPTEGYPARHVGRHHRCWPNQVSGDYCALIDTGRGYDEEHWYDDQGQPVDPASPAIRNVVRRPDREALKAAFAAGAGSTGRDVDDRFETWLAALDRAA